MDKCDVVHINVLEMGWRLHSVSEMLLLSPKRLAGPDGGEKTEDRKRARLPARV